MPQPSGKTHPDLSYPTLWAARLPPRLQTQDPRGLAWMGVLGSTGRALTSADGAQGPSRMGRTSQPTPYHQRTPSGVSLRATVELACGMVVPGLCLSRPRCPLLAPLGASGRHPHEGLPTRSNGAWRGLAVIPTSASLRSLKSR